MFHFNVDSKGRCTVEVPWMDCVYKIHLALSYNETSETVSTDCVAIEDGNNNQVESNSTSYKHLLKKAGQSIERAKAAYREMVGKTETERRIEHIVRISMA